MRKFLLKTIGGALFATSMATAQAELDHLLITEVGIGLSVQTDEASAEYIEIYNPTLAPVPLDNYYISDSNSYKDFPKTGAPMALGTTDQIAKFPAGTTLQPGQIAVVCGGATNFLNLFHGGSLSNFTSQPGSPLLFEVGNTLAELPNKMVTFNSNATRPKAFNFTNTGLTNGEFAVLFSWNPADDLVKDVDIVQWGGQTSGGNSFAPKTTANTGRNNTPYLADAGGPEKLTIGTQGQVITRRTVFEYNEIATNGNGITGHDESTEENWVPWVAGSQDTATPGVADLTQVGENIPPLILTSDRDIHLPSSSQAITLSATVIDPESAITAVRFQVNTGSGFAPVNATLAGSNNYTATIGPFASGTTVKYYVEAVDAANNTALLPLNAPTGFKSFLVDDAPVRPGDVVINEVVYDHSGSDVWEFVEIKNNRNTPVNVSGLRYADANRNWVVVPDNTIIPPFGYLVFVYDSVEFQNRFPEQVPGVTYVDYDRAFALNNTAVVNAPDETLYLVHPNDYDFNNELVELDIVAYDVDGAWPDVGGSFSSMELRNGEFDNADPASWGASVPNGETPGRKNSNFIAAYISNVTRSIAYPAANTPVTISATVDSLSATTTVQQVRLYYGSNNVYNAPVPMTLSTPPNVYTGTIPGQASGTVANFYIEVVNIKPETSTDPALAPGQSYTYLVGAEPIPPDTIVINEVLYDNVGGDAYEYIELFNRTANPVDISFCVLSNRANQPFILPAGTVVPANGYMILSESDFYFRAVYGQPAGVPRVDWLDTFNLNNTSDTVKLTHPNEYSSDGSGVPIASVEYTTSAPWPTYDPETSQSVTIGHPNVTGRSIELINPNYPDRATNGARWGWTTNIVSESDPRAGGTPGVQNSIYSTAFIKEWTLY